MKINLLLNNPKGVLNNYCNIDPFGDGKTSLVGDVTDLSHCVDDGEAEQILARNILEYFPLSQAPNVVVSWLRKLKRYGKLIIEGTDYEKVAMDIYYGKIEFSKYHELMYGKQASKWDFKKCCLSMNMLVRFIEEMKTHGPIEVTQKRYDGYNFIIEITK